MLKARRGFSLVEVLVAMVIFSMIIAALTGAVMTVQRSSYAQTRGVLGQEALRVAQMTINFAMRNAAANPLNAAGAGIVPDPLNTGAFNNVRVVSDFNPADGSFNGPMEDVLIYTAGDTLFVRWQAGGTPQAVAFPVQNLLFRFFAADGTQITNPANVNNQARRVRVTMQSPPDPRSGDVERIESWIYLRNRR